MNERNTNRIEELKKKGCQVRKSFRAGAECFLVWNGHTISIPSVENRQSTAIARMEKAITHGGGPNGRVSIVFGDDGAHGPGSSYKWISR